MLNNIKTFNKNIIVLSLGLALSACGSDLNEVVPTPEPTPVVNTAPSITSTSVDAATAGTDYSYTLAATDADGDTLTMSATTAPDWLMFNAESGVLSGMPADTDGGDSAIVLVVSDGTDEVTQSFTITVTVPEPVNTAAVITSTAVTSATVGQAYSYTLTATDVDEDMLTMSATVPAALSWLSFDADTGILSGMPSADNIAATEISLIVNDGTADTNQSFIITVAEAMAGPETVLVVYEDIDNPDWPLWGDSGATTSIIEDADTDYGQVANFVINGSTVAGFNNRDSGADPFAIPEGILTLEFDLKMIALPTAGATDWMVKLEGTGAKEADFTTSVEGVAPVLDTWMHYTFNVANFDVTDINLVMIFPKWGTGDGAEYSIDNVTFNVTPDDGTRTPGDSGDGATTTDTQGIDFEGSQLTWGSFDTAKVQYIDNPDMTGTNTSSTVALLDILKGDGDWAGARTEGIATFTLDATNCVVKLDVNRDTIGVMHVKFEKQNGDGFGSAGTVTATNTVVNEWETLTFNTCDWIGNPETDVIDGFAIHADQTANRSQDIMVHFDNIMFTAQSDVAPADGPTEGAPVPTATDADVIAVFSDTYTAVADVITDPDWGQGTDTTVIDVAGNNTLKMAGLDYQGIQFATQDVSGKSFLHVDYWTADATTFDVFLISAGPLETAYTITTTTGGWQSVHIPLSAFSDVVNLADVFQFKFVGGGTIFVDNLHFH